MPEGGRATRSHTARWLQNHSILAVLAGAIAALGQPPFDLWPVALVGLAAVYGLFRHAQNWRHAAKVGWAAGTGYFAASMFWIVEPFLVDPLRHGWMAPFALFFMSTGLALFWAAASALAFRASGRPLAWIAALTLAEMLRSYVLTGFPWGLVGYVLADTPLAQFGAYVGPHGLTALALTLSVTLWRLGQRQFVPAGLYILCYIGMFVFGHQIERQETVSPEGAPIVRLTQPNAAQHLKWDPDMIPVFFQRQLEFTAAEPRPDIIVWPETSVPNLLEWAGPDLQEIARVASGAKVVLGLRRRESRRLYNSLAVMGSTGQLTGLYDKHHLVPFGEYVPFGRYLKHIGLKGLAAEDGDGFSGGPGARLVRLDKKLRALPLICYEAIFPQDVNAAAERPDLLLQITNDAWFGKFSGPYQHLAQARMRAIEQGLPMVRAANTGVSAIIDSRGRITGKIPLGTTGFVDARLPGALPPTLYSKIGDFPFAILFALLLTFLLLRHYRHKGK